MSTDRQPKGTPVGGQFAATGRPAPDPSATLEVPVTPASLGLEVGQSRQVASRAGFAALEDVRVHRTDAGYELRADTWVDFTALHAEAYQGLDIDAGQYPDDEQQAAAGAFLTTHQGAVDEFLADRWGATQDDTTEWDDTRVELVRPLDDGVDLGHVDSLLDEDERTARFADDAGPAPAPGRLADAFREFVDARAARD